MQKKKKNSLLASLPLWLFVFLFKFSFSENSDSLIISNYQKAYEKLNNMLSSKSASSFENAIFTIENAYYDNQLSKTEFTNTINFHTKRILQLANANKNQLSQNMPKAVNPLTPSPSERDGERLLFNWAIYTYMTDTTYWKERNEYVPNYPMTYQKEDPYGKDNWENTQVKTLLDPTKKTGNCFSLAVLYKIFSDRLQSEAYLTSAPQHIYIQHKGLDGNFYNVELTTHTFPGSGTIKTYTYTTHDAVTNGISLRRLDEKQEIALCLVYLAKGLEHKSLSLGKGVWGEDFFIQCAETALQYDSLSINALLLKAQAIESRIQRETKNNSHKETGSNDYNNLNATLFNLYALGYREMPEEMQNLLLNIAHGSTPFSPGRRAGDEGLFATDQTLQYLTLSENLFPELESSENLIAIGNTTIDIQSQKISTINTTKKLVAADPISFALTIDPMAEKFPSMSPYNAMDNNPINMIDLDGRESESAIDIQINQKRMEISKIETKIDISKREQAVFLNAMSQLNCAREHPMESMGLRTQYYYIYYSEGKKIEVYEAEKKKIEDEIVKLDNEKKNTEDITNDLNSAPLSDDLPDDLVYPATQAVITPTSYPIVSKPKQNVRVKEEGALPDAPSVPHKPFVEDTYPLRLKQDIIFEGGGGNEDINNERERLNSNPQNLDDPK